MMPAPPTREPLPPLRAARAALRDVRHTLQNLRAHRNLALFLLAFLFFNDGIQTVISQSSVFASRELDFQTDELIGLILMVQIVALPGAIIVGWLSDRWGQKPTLMLCLLVWIALVAVAYFITSQLPFWILGVVLALVMGGTQSVSRAIMGRLTPPEHAAEMFGFFNFSGKATSFLGPLMFGIIIHMTDSARSAIVSLLVFFFIGVALLRWVKVPSTSLACSSFDDDLSMPC